MAKKNNRAYGGKKVYACPRRGSRVYIDDIKLKSCRRNPGEEVACSCGLPTAFKGLLKFDSKSEHRRYINIKNNFTQDVQLHQRLMVAPQVTLGQLWPEWQFSSLATHHMIFYPEKHYTPDFIYEYEGQKIVEEHKGSADKNGKPYVRDGKGDLMRNLLGVTILGYRPIVSCNHKIFIPDRKFKNFVYVPGGLRGLKECWEREHEGN